MRYMAVLAAVSTAALMTGAAAAGPAAHHLNRGAHMHARMIPIMIAVLDANGDGAVSFDEIEAVHKRLFDQMDANKDGKLTPDEMHPRFNPMGMDAPPPPTDKAKGGMMKREVIIRRGPEMMGGPMRGRGMFGGMMGMGPMMVAVMDTNNDGAVSFKEMQAVHKRIFNVIDANKDGKITADEAEAFFGDGR